jgi:hypothetical protein
MFAGIKPFYIFPSHMCQIQPVSAIRIADRVAAGTGTGRTVHDVRAGRLEWAWFRDSEASPRSIR